MKKIVSCGVIVLLLSSIFWSCGSSNTSLNKGTDTLSYVVGMSVGQALIEMDSTLNIDMVCAAIRDTYKGKAKMTMAQAHDYYLAEKTYFVHEKAKAYEEQFLTDLIKSDRKYVRTRNGVTYKILTLGDQSRQGSMSSRDTVRIVYTITDESGRVYADNDTLRDSYRNLVKGLQDVVKLAGKGAHFNAWLPSKTAYGTSGNSEMGISSNTLLNYDVKILDIKYNR